MKEFFNKTIDWTSQDRENFLNESRVKKMIRLVPSFARVLDMGCFTGDMLEEIRTKRSAVEVWGADCNESFVDMTLKKNIPACATNFEKFQPFDEERFDVVVAGELIEHIYNTEVFLSEIHRMLKPNGLLILSTPNFNYWAFRLHHLLGHTLPVIGLESGDNTEFPPHIRYYNKKSLNTMLEKNGFKVDRIIGSNILNQGPWKLEGLANIVPDISYHLIAVARKG